MPAFSSVQPLSVQPRAFVGVLSVSPHDEDHYALKTIFSHSRWTLHKARSCADALKFLGSTPVGVVVCERDLPHGSWKDLFYALERVSHPPRLIVTSGVADD